MNTDAKIPHKNLAESLRYTKITYYNNMGFIWVMKTGSTVKNQSNWIHPINLLQKKSHMIILIM